MRIRTIKPEFWIHEGLCQKSEFTRLLAIALLNWADDEGYFMANPILIKSQLFPFEDDSKKVLGSIQDLSCVGWIRLGKDTQNRSVGMIVNFSKHQRVDKPKPSEIKACSTFQDESKIDLGCVLAGKERKGRGMEGNPPNPQGGMEDDELIPSEIKSLPANWQRMSEKIRKQTKAHRNTEPMQTIGAWFGRKPETLWTVAEAVALNQINPSPAEVAGMGRYYTADIPADDYRRRDLQTLLNNWSGELDRARAFVTKQSA